MNTEVRPQPNSRRATLAGLSTLAIAMMLATAGTAQAQTAAATDTIGAQPDAQPTEDQADVVVTGTLLRGVAPTGTNVIGITQDTIVARGVNSSNDLLAKIPQVGNFGTIPVGLANFGLPIVRPNIRNLGASGGNTTLVLLNGQLV